MLPAVGQAARPLGVQPPLPECLPSPEPRWGQAARAAGEALPFAPETLRTGILGGLPVRLFTPGVPMEHPM